MTDPTPKPTDDPPAEHPPEVVPHDAASPSVPSRDAAREPVEAPPPHMPEPPPVATAHTAQPEPPPYVPPRFPEPETGPQIAPPRAQRSRSALPVLSALGFLLLLAGLAWVWNEQQQIDARLDDLAQQQQLAQQQLQHPPAPPPSVDPAQLAALEARVKTLESKLAEAPRPAPVAPPPDLGPLEARVTALEGRKPPPPVDVAAGTAPLQAKLDRLVAGTAPLQSKLEGIAAEIVPIQAKLQSLAADVAATKAGQASQAAQLAEISDQVKAAEQKQSALADRAAQLQQVARAEVALAAGQPLGDMPATSPALVKFASAKPPTEAELRLGFPAAAAAAEKASQPSVAGKSLAERMWLRARQLVTVKQGDAVLVGAPAATVIGRAQARLDAGDLAGTVAALDGLDPSAAQAMAPWREQAQSLLDARAALAQMARG